MSCFYLLVIFTEHQRRSTPSPLREMASNRYLAGSEEQQEMDRGHGLFDATLQPVVKLYRIGMGPFIYLLFFEILFTGSSALAPF